MPETRTYTDPTPEGDADLLVSCGGSAVKALGQGRVAGYVVRFTGPEQPDLAGEFFTKATDFGIEMPAKVGLYYHHGMDPTIGKRRLGRATVKADDIGVWFETQLDLADQYQAAVYQLTERGRMGASSGAAAHLVEKSPAGKAVRIDQWNIGEVSLTPTPCEPGCQVATVKSLDVPTFADLLAEVKSETRTFTTPAGSLAERTEQWIERGSDLLAGYRQVRGAETKVGRALSTARRSRLEQMREQIGGLLGELDALLTETAPREAAGESETPTETKTEAAPGMGAGGPATTVAQALAQFEQTQARLAGVAF
jgi:HK97 family phage prohead protease